MRCRGEVWEWLGGISIIAIEWGFIEEDFE